MTFNRDYWLWDVFKEAVNMAREERAKPLHQKLVEASAEGDYQRVEKLLRHRKADINYRDADGQTALMKAVMHGANKGLQDVGLSKDNLRVIAVLLAHNADTSGVDAKGRDLKALAAGDNRILEMLPRGNRQAARKPQPPRP